MPVSRNQIKPALIEIILVVTLLNAFAIYKLYKKVDSLAVHTAALSSQSAPTPTVDVSLDDDEVDGADGAPVTIVEFTDYECSFCARYFEQTYPQIHQKYVETGKVKYVVRDFPAEFHPQAQKAAEAAECAGEQGDYWGMHYTLFENQQALDVPSLKVYAEEVGLDVASFSDCLDSGAKRAVVAADHRDALSHGVSGTPTFFVNGRVLVGAQQLAAFEALLTDVEAQP